MNKKHLVTVQEAALIADVSVRTVFRWLKGGLLTRYSTPTDKPRIDPEQLTPLAGSSAAPG